MSVTATSKEAYKSLAKLGQRQRVVYEQIKTMEKQAYNSAFLPSNADIARELGLPINEVTPRSLELRSYGWVRVHGKKKDAKTGKSVQTLCTANPNDSKLVDMFEPVTEQVWRPTAVSWLND